MKRKSTRKYSRRKQEELGGCPTPRAHKRLEDVHKLWHQTEQNYFSPDDFRINLNNTVQTFRSVTFVLQKNKRLIPDFDNWYEGWREEMRADRVMRWLVDARNKIVKEGDLETLSTVRLYLVAGWGQPPTRDYVVSPKSTFKEIVEDLLSEDIPENIRDNGSIIIQRRWVVDDLPDWELLEAVAHGFGYLTRLINDAHVQSGVPIPQLVECEREDSTKSTPVPSEHLSGRYPCMIGSPFDRSRIVKLATGEEVNYSIDSTVYKHPPTIEVAMEHYGFDPLKVAEEAKKAFESGFRSSLYYYMKHAKLLLSVDGALIPTVLLSSEKGSGVIDFTLPSDKSELLLFWQKVIADIKRTGADSCIMISEVWIRSPLDEGNKDSKKGDGETREGIQVMGANAQGEECTLLTPFRWHGEQIIYEDTQEMNEIQSPQINSLRRVWQELRTSDNS